MSMNVMALLGLVLGMRRASRFVELHLDPDAGSTPPGRRSRHCLAHVWRNFSPASL